MQNYLKTESNEAVAEIPQQDRSLDLFLKGVVVASDPSRCGLRTITRSTGYLSEWDDDKVVLDMSVDRYRGTAEYDFSKIYIRCIGKASPVEGIRSLLSFPTLRDPLKALLNILDDTFSKSNKKRSEVSRNFNGVIRFLSWSIQNRGIYTLSNISRADFDSFLEELSAARFGILEITGCLPSLDNLIADLKNNKIPLQDVISSKKWGRTHLITRAGFISNYLGVPIEGLPLPSDFYRDLELIAGKKRRGAEYTEPDNKNNVVYSYAKALNRLWDLPNSVDKTVIKPYPLGFKTAKSLKGRDLNVGSASTDGRTANICLDDAIKIIQESILWIYTFGTTIIELAHCARDVALECRDTISPKLRRKHFWPTFTQRANEICQRAELPFKIVSTQAQVYDGHSVTIDNLVNGLMTACFCMIAVNHGRRLNEIIGVYNLPGGMYFGCVSGETPFPDMQLIDFYVEKTLQDWALFPANKLVIKAVETLEGLAQESRSFDTPLLVCVSDVVEARKRKLFRRRWYVGWESFEGESSNYIYGDHSSFFLGRIGLSASQLDGRAHPYRRLFALIYYHRFDKAELLALSFHLRHLLPSTTAVYVTDPAARKTADRINQVFNQEQAKIEDEVRSEAFVNTIVEILDGRRSGGKWPRLVLAMYAKLIESVEFIPSDAAMQAKTIAETMQNDGYQRQSFYFGGCNVGATARTASQALCLDQVGVPQYDRACPQLCSQCVHHDSNAVTISILEQRAQSIDQLALSAPDSLPTVKEGLQREADVLRNVIRTENLLSNETISLFEKVRGTYQRALEGFSNV